MHGGKAAIGPAAPAYIDGRWRGSKYGSVLPADLAAKFDLTKVEQAASCREELALVDARTAEVLDNIRKVNPTGVVAHTRSTLALLEIALDEEDLDAARRVHEVLEQLLGEQAAVASGWDEIHRLLDTRAKLSRAELGWQKLLSDRVLIEHIDAFVQALIREAKVMLDAGLDRKVLSVYVQRVVELGRGVVAPALLPPDVVDGEVVTKEEEP